MKTYEEIQEILNNNRIDKQDFESSNLFKYLNENHIEYFYANITSMCLKTNPDRIRIRSDKFLNNALNQNNTVLIVGIIYKDSKRFLLFPSNYFANYNKSANQSNSVINFSFKTLQYFLNTYLDIPIIATNTEIKYSFMIIDDEYINIESIKMFLKTSSQYQFNLNNQIKYFTKLVPNIDNEIKEMVRAKSDFFCSLVDNKIHSCPCGNKINIDFMLLNDILYTHIHHICPKEFLINHLIKINNFVDPNIINNPINLIALCNSCHMAIHKSNSNPNLVLNVFNAIIDFLKRKDLYKEFESYLKGNQIYLNNLLQYYLKGDNDE